MVRGDVRGLYALTAGELPPIQIRITEARDTIKSLAIELSERARSAQAGLMTVAYKVEADARKNMAKHHYHGRAEGAIKTWVSFESPTYLRISVGIPGNTFAPEGATFERGWRSKAGKTPPSAPFAEWALERGIAKTIPRARQIGFIIAFRQGQKPGYTFGQDKWLTRAWENADGADAVSTVSAFVMAGHERAHSARGTFAKFITPL